MRRRRSVPYATPSPLPVRRRQQAPSQRGRQALRDRQDRGAALVVQQRRESRAAPIAERRLARSPRTPAAATIGARVASARSSPSPSAARRLEHDRRERLAHGRRGARDHARRARRAASGPASPRRASRWRARPARRRRAPPARARSASPARPGPRAAPARANITRCSAATPAAPRSCAVGQRAHPRRARAARRRRRRAHLVGKAGGDGAHDRARLALQPLAQPVGMDAFDARPGRARAPARSARRSPPRARPAVRRPAPRAPPRSARPPARQPRLDAAGGVRASAAPSTKPFSSSESAATARMHGRHHRPRLDAEPVATRLRRGPTLRTTSRRSGSAAG